MAGMEGKEVLWGGRTAEKPNEEAFIFQASICIDKRLVQDDIHGSRVHVSMLSKQGIIPQDTAVVLDAELLRIAEELANGSLVVDESAEDVHSFVEAELTRRLGDAGRMVHAGRSRNDQVMLDFKLYLKQRGAELCGQIEALMATLLDRAEEYVDALMPGYTHLQRAQPVTLGFHLIAWVCALERDLSRFRDALFRMDECPLGSGALAGSDLPLDREETAAHLGFRAPTLNAMDSVADRDFAIELASAAAICQIHLSRFCEDVVLWASAEFGFLDLSEKWSTGSSIMPQKKNPDFAELIRGKSGRAVGNLVALLTLLKGIPYAYDKDLQEDKDSLFDSLDTVSVCLQMFRGMIAASSFNRERMETACIGGFSEATDAADYLVRKGLPFRKAHEVSALIVRDCIDAGQSRIGERTLEELQARSPLFEADIFDALSPVACVNARKTLGGTAFDETRRQIAVLRTRGRLSSKTAPSPIRK
ncbi:MAG: argininosuccinate lyase [Treponema sp.]|jgi:argininosuccinate lyase|nr:argininosuccinate lyase [Treponema sp.]